MDKQQAQKVLESSNIDGDVSASIGTWGLTYYYQHQYTKTGTVVHFIPNDDQHITEGYENPFSPFIKTAQYTALCGLIKRDCEFTFDQLYEIKNKRRCKRCEAVLKQIATG